MMYLRKNLSGKWRDQCEAGGTTASQQEAMDLEDFYLNLKQFEQDCIPVGCVPPTCCSYLPECTGGGVLGPGGCLVLEGFPACNGADPPPPPWTEFLTRY